MGEVLDSVKHSLRREMRTTRRHTPPVEAGRRAAAACARLLASSWFCAAQQVVVYAAIDGEIDPAPVARAAAEAGKAVYYPDEAAVGFAARSTGPSPTRSSPLAPPGEGVLFVVPGVAFDGRGARLGRGGGWYDRALARYPRGMRLGFAFDFQVVARVPEDAWDVRMHAVVTDARLLDANVASLGQ